MCGIKCLINVIELNLSFLLSWGRLKGKTSSILSLPTVSSLPPIHRSARTLLSEVLPGLFCVQRSMERIRLPGPPSPISLVPCSHTSFRVPWTLWVCTCSPSLPPPGCLPVSRFSPQASRMIPHRLLLECPAFVCSVFANRKKSDRSSYPLQMCESIQPL